VAIADVARLPPVGGNVNSPWLFGGSLNALILLYFQTVRPDKYLPHPASPGGPADRILRLPMASAALIRLPAHLAEGQGLRLQRPAANAVLTAVVDAWGQSWTPRCLSRPSGLIRRTVMDSRGPGHSPGKRTVGVDRRRAALAPAR